MNWESMFGPNKARCSQILTHNYSDRTRKCLLSLFLFRFGNDSSRRINKVEDGFSSKRCLNWFKQYTTPQNPELLGPDGMEQFCEDIGVEPENVVMLGKYSNKHLHSNFAYIFRHFSSHCIQIKCTPNGLLHASRMAKRVYWIAMWFTAKSSVQIGLFEMLIRWSKHIQKHLPVRVWLRAGEYEIPVAQCEWWKLMCF